MVTVMTQAASTPTSKGHGTRNRAIWISIAAVCLALGGTVFFSHSIGLSPNEASAATTEDASLHLKALPAGNRLILSWDDDAGLAATADRATLTISDGNRTESVDLDLNYFRLGQLSYQPISHDISFRLRVSSMKQGRNATGYVRLLNFQPQEETQAADLNSIDTARTEAPLTEDSTGAASITVDAFPATDTAVTPSANGEPDTSSVPAASVPDTSSEASTPATDLRTVADARTAVAAVAQTLSK